MFWRLFAHRAACTPAPLSRTIELPLEAVHTHPLLIIMGRTRQADQSPASSLLGLSYMVRQSELLSSGD
jgi:hypothetical protein